MTIFSIDMMRQKIALVYGGNSSEWEISVMSGKNVAQSLDSRKYDVYEILLRGSDWSCRGIQVDKTDFSVTLDEGKVKFDVALIMIHGTPGENGLLQGYFEMIGVPYTTCSSYVSSLTFDKFACKTFMRDVNIPMAKDVYLRRGDSYSVETIAEHLGLPVFVKPSDGGSSFGITKVKRIEDLDTAIKSAFEEGETVLLEQFIEGRELTQGVYFDGNDIVPLPITEIISHNEYFDYDAKYNGKSDEICPADIPQEVAATVSKYTCRIYHHFGCMGIVRCDYIVRPDGKVFFLEINTVPGMTKMSLVPAQIKAAGLNLSEILDNIISQASGK